MRQVVLLSGVFGLLLMSACSGISHIGDIPNTRPVVECSDIYLEKK